MTDRELLESIRAQITAHLEPIPVPVDCVWGSWSDWGAWSAWAPIGNGEEQRTRTRARQIETPALNGGLECVGPFTDTETEVRAIVVTPIDCVWSAWSVWSPWSAWIPISNTQEQRTRSRSRTHVVEAENGGADCTGSATETQTETRDIATPPPDGAKHLYFNDKLSHPNLIAAYSLRDPQQLLPVGQGGYSISNAKPQAVTYTWPDDSYPYKQDAAKIVVPATMNSLQNQVRVPIPRHAPQSLATTWEVWFGDEWHRNVTGFGMVPYKTWQFASPRGKVHSEVRMHWNSDSDDFVPPWALSLVDGRLYNDGGYSQGPNITTSTTLKPRAGTFGTAPRTWFRLVVFMDAPNADGWWAYSIWGVGPAGVVLIYDQLLIKPKSTSSGNWEEFWLEYNTSTVFDGRSRPPLVAYARNVLMFKGLTRAEVIRDLLPDPYIVTNPTE